MASRVRLLPALIAVSVGALAFKGVDLAQAVAEGALASGEAEGHGEEEAPPEGEAAAEGEGGAEGAEKVAGSETCVPSIDYAAETGLSQSEIQVLRSLADRRTELDKREEELASREQTSAAATARLDEQIAELKALETKVQGLLDSMESKKDERLDALVKTYESMKPKDAARIFEAMDQKILLQLAKRMKSQTLGAILASMAPEKAERLTSLLAGLAEVPDSVDKLGALPG